MRDVLRSVGIDVGTTTSQVVFSDITIEDLSGGFAVPRVEIVDKRVVYRGAIHFTPLSGPDQIDAEALRRLVGAEYALAGVEARQVRTGAVVITGLSARTRNADEVAQALSDLAGDFVVATAGPTLESVLAGRGAGADVRSRELGRAVANYDIGGGTSNFALFEDGEPVAASCLDVGGRLIRIERGVVTHVGDKVARLCAARGVEVRVGSPADLVQLRRAAQAMCQILEMSLGLVPKSPDYPSMLTEPGKDVVLPRPIGGLTLSGGVADCALAPDPDPFVYGDLGVLLGQAIAASGPLARLPRLRAEETIRATVVGAGTHITRLSGSTIEYDAALLPLKNVPAIKLTPQEEATPAAMERAIRDRRGWYGDASPVAVAFVGPADPSFAQVQGIASAIVSGLASAAASGAPTVVVTEHDLAKVLGQAIRARTPAGRPFVCVDQVAVSGGDYVDIGEPAAGGAVLPVVVKTLLFH